MSRQCNGPYNLFTSTGTLWNNWPISQLYNGETLCHVCIKLACRQWFVHIHSVGVCVCMCEELLAVML